MRYLLLVVSFLLSAYIHPYQYARLVDTGMDSNSQGNGVTFRPSIRSPNTATTIASSGTYRVSRRQLLESLPDVRSGLSMFNSKRVDAAHLRVSSYHSSDLIETAVVTASSGQNHALVPDSQRSIAARQLVGSFHLHGVEHPPCVRVLAYPGCRPQDTISSDLVSIESRPSKEEDKILLADTIVIVIDDFGYRNDVVLDAFMQLDARLTFAIIPGHTYSESTASMASERGYEVLVHMPMEALKWTPGELEYRLTLSMSSEEIRRRLRDAFRTLPQASGLNNHQGSAVTGDARVMRVVGSELKRFDKFFLDSRTSPWSVAEDNVALYGVASTHRDVFLDNYDDMMSIRHQINILAEIARSEGFAVGIGHARYNTAMALRDAIPRLKDAGFEFAYVSQVVR